MPDSNLAPPLPPGAKPELHVLLAGPRGFCAGVDRAIKIVEEAIRQYGAPVYVRHEIVHNRFVVESLETQGAIFVEELDEIPDDGQPVVFSAHGVPKAIPSEAEHHHARGRHILMIGHDHHPEVIGTMGQLPEGSVTLVEDEAQARVVDPPKGLPLAFITQTTLSVDDTAEMVRILSERFPGMSAPAKEDICYATTNRQAAVKAIAPRAQLMIVVGAPNSSNSLRLVEVASRAGSARSIMVQRGRDLDLALLEGVTTVGVTAGASAPEVLVEEVLDRLRQRYTLRTEEVVVAEEKIIFKLPAALTQAPV